MLKTKYLLPLILILLLTFTLGGYSAWLAGWDYRIEISIGDYAGDFGGSVTWFPVTIFLKDANGESTKIFEEIGNNYRKMAITKNDGTTELKGEIEGWNYDAGTPANSTGFIHTSADGWTINSNTSVWVYYDNDHADNANINVTNTSAAEAVWRGEFDRVLHLANGVDNEHIYDSTDNNNDGTKDSAGNPTEATGKIGQAQDFASTDFITTPNKFWAENTDFTISFWVNFTAYNNYQNVLSSTYDNATNGFWLEFGTTRGFTIYSNGSKVFEDTEQSLTGLSTGIWYYIVITRSGTGTNNLKGYIDNVLFGQASLNLALGDATNTLLIGKYGQTATVYWFDGLTDEIRTYDGAYSEAWRNAEYNFGLDAVFTYGSEETAPVEEAANIMIILSTF